jgi:23S rRNA G2069 N7-methylase RlmK/C1962 C5-methylase RlmI
MAENPALYLKPGREKSVLRRHPWIFSGAVARVDGNPASGATVDLLASNGQFLAILFPPWMKPKASGSI